jgi:predicted hydrocarbon binding protein
LNVLKKLIDSRVALQHKSLNKSGHNKFAGYKYFELADFLPTVQQIFQEKGLVDVISFTETLATMIVFDIEDGSSVSFTSPMGSANLKGCHEVQNIGAVESYQRRYLYTTALAIVENDVLDAVTGDDAKPVVKEVVKEVVKQVAAIEKPDQKMLLGKLIEWAEACNTEDELKSIWKANQSKIDEIKSSDADGYKRLQGRFAELKLKLKGE